MLVLTRQYANCQRTIDKNEISAKAQRGTSLQMRIRMHRRDAFAQGNTKRSCLYCYLTVAYQVVGIISRLSTT